jgi:5'(3')-deoxyribonucleotidase
MTTERLIVGVDVDEVCAHLIPEWMRRYNLAYGDTVCPEDVKYWHMPDNVKPECGDAIYDFMREPDLYDNIVPIMGARAAVKEIRRMGHRVVFVTSCITGTADAKIRWLERWGFLQQNVRTHKDFIAASDKALVNVDVLFDDNADTVANFPRHAVIVTQPHNRDARLPGRLRISALSEAPEVIRKKLYAADF